MMLDWNTKTSNRHVGGEVTFDDGHDGNSKANEDLEE